MSVIFINGMETWDLSEWEDIVGGVFEGTVVRSGNGALALPAGDNRVLWDGRPNETEYADWAFSFGFRISATPSATTRMLLVGGNIAAPVVRLELRINTSRQIVLYDPSGPTGSTALDVDTWYLICIVVDSVANTVKIYLDDSSTPEIDHSGALAGDDVWTWQPRNASGSGATFYFDDCRADDVAARIGLHNIVALCPNGNGNDAWDSGGYADIDDWITGAEDDTATEASLTASPSTATDTVEDPTDSVIGIDSGDTINAVFAAGIIKRGGGGGANSHHYRIRDHAPTDNDSADLGLSNQYEFVTWPYPSTMPTPAQLGSWEIGGRTSGAQNFVATALALMVDYTPSAGPTDFPLDCGPGSYSMIGAVATALLLGGMILASPSSYALAGVAASPLAGRAIDAEPNAYTVSGVSASLLLDAMVNAEPDGYALNGIDASLLRGLFLDVDSDVYSITGVDTTLLIARGLNASPATYSITGVAGTLLGDRLLSVDPGVYSLSGVDASLNFGYVIITDVGAYIVTGVDVTLLIGRGLNASPGSYTMSGVDTTLLRDALLSVNPGGYTISGAGATFAIEIVLNAASGIYSVTGVDVTPILDRILLGDVGSYNLTGVNTGALVGRILSANPSSYSIAGQSAGLLAGYLLVTDIGSYLVMGSDATLVVGRMLDAGVGIYSITGIDAGLVGPAAVDYPLNMEPGVYALTGDLGNLLASRLVLAAPGVYAVSGDLATLEYELPYLEELIIYYRSRPLRVTAAFPF